MGHDFSRTLSPSRFVNPLQTSRRPGPLWLFFTCAVFLLSACCGHLDRFTERARTDAALLKAKPEANSNKHHLGVSLPFSLLQRRVDATLRGGALGRFKKSLNLNPGIPGVGALPATIEVATQRLTIRAGKGCVSRSATAHACIRVDAKLGLDVQLKLPKAVTLATGVRPRYKTSMSFGADIPVVARVGSKGQSLIGVDVGSVLASALGEINTGIPIARPLETLLGRSVTALAQELFGDLTLTSLDPHPLGDALTASLAYARTDPNMNTLYLGVAFNLDSPPLMTSRRIGSSRDNVILAVPPEFLTDVTRAMLSREGAGTRINKDGSSNPDGDYAVSLDTLTVERGDVVAALTFWRLSTPCVEAHLKATTPIIAGKNFRIGEPVLELVEADRFEGTIRDGLKKSKGVKKIPAISKRFLDGSMLPELGLRLNNVTKKSGVISVELKSTGPS